MTTHEYHKEAWKQLKGQPLKAKLTHIFTYYRYPILGAVLVLAVVISLSISIGNQKEPAFQAYLFGAAGTKETSDQFLTNFAQTAEIDRDAYSLGIGTSGFVSENGLDENSILAAQTIAVRISAQELDILGGMQNRFLNYAYSEYFSDLSEVFSDEQLQQWSARLIYIDAALLGQELPEELPDPTAPEKMENPKAVGLFFSADSSLSAYCTLPEDGLILGIVMNAPHRDAAIAFLQFCA